MVGDMTSEQGDDGPAWRPETNATPLSPLLSYKCPSPQSHSDSTHRQVRSPLPYTYPPYTPIHTDRSAKSLILLVWYFRVRACTQDQCTRLARMGGGRGRGEGAALMPESRSGGWAGGKGVCAGQTLCAGLAHCAAGVTFCPYLPLACIRGSLPGSLRAIRPPRTQRRYTYLVVCSGTPSHPAAVRLPGNLQAVRLHHCRQPR